MKNLPAIPRMLPVVLAATTLAFAGGCTSFHQWGAERTAAMDECADVTGYERVFVETPDVKSEEQTEEALAKDAKYVTYLHDALVEAIRSRIPKTASGADRFEIVDASASNGGAGTLVVSSKLRIVYGSRAARWVVGFGAGKGSVELSLRLVDPGSRDEKLEVHGSARLSIGILGGSMDNTITDVIDQAAEDFADSIARSVESHSPTNV